MTDVAEGCVALEGDQALQIRKVTLEVDEDRLRRLLAERGVTLAALARELGLGRSSISNWWRDGRTAPAARLIACGKFLQAPVEDFCHVHDARGGDGR